MVADRVNVVEGIISDLLQGRVPNFFAERGFKSEWKYNKKEVVRKAVIGVLVSSFVIILLANRNKRKKKFSLISKLI